ncbi:hypothetical protein VDG07_09160 [Xanthomonas campestris pv. raphani]|uniref:hypothetical protein n=1 Tax=Xanthomonas campestris TaxID=339 RepID=UPI002B23E071|nr:hypothetical protein [Xanthomonas campestris]MEA9758613.1 hypothetical protein [Xanthomonas campestris pv. raphani]MEA9795515.1 hypothetical protein [Xanthomonas campestris pv. raphani]
MRIYVQDATAADGNAAPCRYACLRARRSRICACHDFVAGETPLPIVATRDNAGRAQHAIVLPNAHLSAPHARH